MKNQLFPPKRKPVVEDVEAAAEKQKKLKNNIF
jgi:hypothetical protein